MNQGCVSLHLFDLLTHLCKLLLKCLYLDSLLVFFLLSFKTHTILGNLQMMNKITDFFIGSGWVAVLVVVTWLLCLILFVMLSGHMPLEGIDLYIYQFVHDVLVIQNFLCLSMHLRRLVLIGRCKVWARSVVYVSLLN